MSKRKRISGGRRPRYYGGGGGRGGGRANTTPNYNPMMFVRKAIPDELADDFNPKHKFSDFEIDSQLLANIKNKGYDAPTPIQDEAIPHLLNGRDVVGVASTGTGKTAAFLIPLINKLINNRGEKVLIVAPTRELAVQVAKEFRELSTGTHLLAAICIGGVGIHGQIKVLSKNPEVVVGTPGRLMDLEKQHKLNFNQYGSIVLDEVDRMLDMGFVHDVRKIISKLSYTRQSLFFSATLPESVKSVMNGFLNNPVSVTVKSQPTSANVDQDIIMINGRDKAIVLDELLGKEEFKKVLVFGRTKRGIEKLGRKLNTNGNLVATIHGNKSQGQRKRALEEFRANRVNVLLATDVASRGLDIDNITHVINYDLPQSYEDYIHRIGRTGRANKKGFALTFIE